MTRFKQWAIYFFLSRLVNHVRIFSNHRRRFLLALSPNSKYPSSTTSSAFKKPRNFINVCVPNLFYGNSYPKNVVRRLDRRFLVEEFFPRSSESSRIRKLKKFDIFHLNFVDVLQLDYPETIQLIGQLQAAKVKIVVTAHDLTPHSKQPEYYDPLFQTWLSAADGIVHHSQWGLTALRTRFQIPERTKNAVIFNLGRRDDVAVVGPKKRRRIETALGIAQVPIRIGIVGAPRKERMIAEFLEGFSRTTRADMQVTCWSLTEQDIVPNDPRIAIAEKYRHVRNRTFRKRLEICDVIAIPYQSDGEMLTTGVVASAMEVGIGILRTDWPFLEEVFGDAGIYIGKDAESFTVGLSRLTLGDIQLAKKASLKLRLSNSWQVIAEQYGRLYESVLAD